jgi:hypothetical protein
MDLKKFLLILLVFKRQKSGQLASNFRLNPQTMKSKLNTKIKRLIGRTFGFKN